MSACHCPRCSDQPLHSYTEPYKRQCLIEWIVGELRKRSSRSARRDFVDLILSNQPGRASIERDIRRLWAAEYARTNPAQK
jgi:hypothetical protein